MATKTLVDTNSVQTVQNKTFDNTNTLTMGTLTSPTINGTISGTAAILPTGATTARPLSTRFADYVNVKDYGAVGDGTTDDTTAVAAAITAAADGREIYWPDGMYLTVGSLSNFHSRRHVGPGVVKRGSTLFYVDPSLNPGVTNNLYVATTGSDTADGLSSTEPRLTVLATGNLIYTYSYGDITWAVNLAAGTYTAVDQTFSKPFPSPLRVQFLGASVSAGVQPTTIIQATGQGAGSAVQGMYFQNYVRAEVRNINFKNYRTNASPDATLLGSGLIADTFCDLYTVNVWTDDCDQGIYCTNGTMARIEAGRHGFNAINGNGVQFIRHSKGTVGYNGTAADVNGATGVAFIGGQRGVLVQEFSMMHADYCYFSTQTFSGALVNTSRIHSVSSTYLSCVVGVDLRFNSNFSNTTNTFTTCTDDIKLLSGSRHAGTPFAETLDLGPPIKQIDAVGASTQSTTPVTILTKAFEAKELATRGAGFKLRMHFEVIGTADTKTIVVTFGSATLVTATIAASTVNYEVQVDLMNVTAASSQKIFTRILQGGVTPTLNLDVTIAQDLTTAKTLTVTHQVTNVADLNRFGFSELEIQH